MMKDIDSRTQIHQKSGYRYSTVYNKIFLMQEVFC